MGIKLNAGEGDNKPKRSDLYSFVPSEIEVDWDLNFSRQGERFTADDVRDLINDFSVPDADGVLVGQVQPVTLWRRPHDNKVEMVAGFRRLFAGLEIEKTKPGFRLDAIVLTELTEKERYLVNLKENVGRKEINLIQRARSAQHLKKTFKYKVSAIATILNISEAQVRNLFSLLNLPDKVQARVASGNLAISVAIKLVKVDPADLDAALEEATDEDGNVDGGKAVKAARSRGVKVGRSASELRAVLKGRDDVLSKSLLGFLSGSVTPETLAEALDTAEAP